MQIILNDKIVRSNTVIVSKEFTSQSSTIQAKKGEKLVSLMPATKKAFDWMGDDIVEISTKNDALKNKKGSCDEKWLQKSKNKLMKQIDDKKIAKFYV